MWGILHKVRNGAARIGLGHDTTPLHQVFDQVVEIAKATNSPMTSGTITTSLGDITVAIAIGTRASADLRLFVTDDD